MWLVESSLSNPTTERKSSESEGVVQICSNMRPDLSPGSHLSSKQRQISRFGSKTNSIFDEENI